MEGKGSGVEHNLSKKTLNQNSPVKDNNELQQIRWEGGAVWKTGKGGCWDYLCRGFLRCGSWEPSTPS